MYSLIGHQTMRVPPCEKGHVISLVGTLASIVVLIVTLYTVWYPYLQTSAFIPAQCIPYKLEIYGPTSCQSSNSESCTTVPTSSLVTEFYNYTTWSTTTSSTTTTTSSTDSSNATVTSSVSTSTTPQTTINPQFPSITIPQNGYCPWFPCVQLNVIFSTTYGVGVVAFGKLYTDYDQMLDYPTVSSRNMIFAYYMIISKYWASADLLAHSKCVYIHRGCNNDHIMVLENEKTKTKNRRCSFT